MPLVRYRRHTKNCKWGHKQNHRTFEPRTPEEKKADCKCPIVVSGTLRRETKRVLHRSTGTNLWKQANATADRWEAWEALTNPNPPAETETEITGTIEESIAAFNEFHGPSFKQWDDDSLRKYNQMFRHRLPLLRLEQRWLRVRIR